MKGDALKEAAQEEDRVFRWLHFGSCTLRIAFDTPEFFGTPYHGLPVKVSKLWRREISSVMMDWETKRSFENDLEPSTFSEAWLSDIEVFRSADVILVDLVLDIFQNYHLRFRRSNDVDGVPYDTVVSNFPEEPPEGLEAELCIFDCNPEDSIRAWEKFGHEIDTPTVFITYENRDDIRPGYSEVFREKLLSFQNAVADLAEKFPHWMVISQDDVFSEIGTSCYIDRHHPSPEGWQVLRKAVPEMISESGLLKADLGGPALPASTKFVPERSDYSAIETEHLQRLATLEGTAATIGPKRLTGFAQGAFGDKPIFASTSFSPLQKQESPGLIVVLKWHQPATMPSWLSGLMKQHPDSIVEIPCLWPGRDSAVLQEDERKLRRDLKVFAKVKADSNLILPALSSFRKRYLARLLLSTHTTDAATSDRLMSVSGGPATETDIVFPQSLIDAIEQTELVPIFGIHS